MRGEERIAVPAHDPPRLPPCSTKDGPHSFSCARKPAFRWVALAYYPLIYLVKIEDRIDQAAGFGRFIAVAVLKEIGEEEGERLEGLVVSWVHPVEGLEDGVGTKAVEEQSVPEH